jgi:hypothetical protein
MTRKLTTAWATVYAATVAGITTVYTNSKKLEANKELVLTNHNLELERMKYSLDTSSLRTNNSILNSVNSSQVIDKTVSQEDLLNDSLGPVRKALLGLDNLSTQPPMSSVQSSKIELNSSGIQLDKSDSIDLHTSSKAGFDFDFLFESYLEQNTLQLVCLTLFLYNIAILICVIGLIVNYHVKLYGDQYMDKLPKWSLPIVKYYLILGQYTNYYYMVSILVSLLLSISFCVLFYFMDLA